MWNDVWIIEFRNALNEAGFSNTQIVAPDRDWGIANDMLANATLMNAVSIVSYPCCCLCFMILEKVGIIGAHYPGTYSTSSALSTNKPLWASEDYSSFADSVGGGCWGRILNQNYVNGFMTGLYSFVF